MIKIWDTSVTKRSIMFNKIVGFLISMDTGGALIYFWLNVLEMSVLTGGSSVTEVPGVNNAVEHLQELCKHV